MFLISRTCTPYASRDHKKLRTFPVCGCFGSDKIRNFNPFELSGIYNLVTLSGSLVAALAVKQGHKTASEIWDLCRVDNIWQEEQWGVDEEAQKIESFKRSEFLLANAYLQL